MPEQREHLGISARYIMGCKPNTQTLMNRLLHHHMIVCAQAKMFCVMAAPIAANLLKSIVVDRSHQIVVH